MSRRSPATVAEAFRLTSSVLRSAVRNRLIAFNPCEDVRLPRRRKQEHDDRVIERDVLLDRLVPVVPERYRVFVATPVQPDCGGVRRPVSALMHSTSTRGLCA